MLKIHSEIEPWAKVSGYVLNRATIIHMPRNMMTVAFNSFRDTVDDEPCIVG
jgi:hypothetical protein